MSLTSRKPAAFCRNSRREMKKRGFVSCRQFLKKQSPRSVKQFANKSWPYRTPLAEQRHESTIGENKSEHRNLLISAEAAYARCPILSPRRARSKQHFHSSSDPSVYHVYISTMCSVFRKQLKKQPLMMFVPVSQSTFIQSIPVYMVTMAQQKAFHGSLLE